MLRTAVCAVAVLALGLTGARAEEMTGFITKVEDGKITFTKFDFKSKEKGEEMKLTLAKDVKVLEAKFNKEEKKVEAGDKLEGGLENKRFKEPGKFGVFAQVITTDNQVTEIRVFPAFKKKKKKADD